MRLASKIFLTSAVVVVVLAGVGVLSLRAIGRLASVNREITTRTVPALRLASSTRDAIPTLVRLEARFLVLDDRLRQALLKAPNLETIKKLSRAAGNRTLQEEGVLLVALGTTSLSELQRVLKQ